MNNGISKNRIWELDFLRGIALILMIYFHTIYDLKDFYNYSVSYSSGINSYIGTISGTLFILISGISSSLSKSNAKRGLKVLGIAMVITLATHLLTPGFGIKFGILHFLGVSMLIYPVFSRLNKYILMVLGAALIAAGQYVSNISAPFDYLFMLGITSNKFISSDYYPLIPWFGFFLFGAAIAKMLYNEKRSIFKFAPKDNIINTAGRNTLVIYILHQPMILLVIKLLDYIK